MTQSCGLVAVVGAPNAGKSTLVNALVGQKVAIVSPKAQTTRTRLMGIAILGDAQLLLVDTPGIFDPARRLDRAMVAAAWEGAKDADLIALVVDGKGGVGPKVRALAESLKDRRERKLLILNKVDIADKPRLLGHAATLNDLGAFDDTYFVSAATGDGVAELKAALAAKLQKALPGLPIVNFIDASRDESRLLLFAGSERGGSNGRGLTYVNPIQPVLDKLEIKLAAD